MYVPKHLCVFTVARHYHRTHPHLRIRSYDERRERDMPGQRNGFVYGKMCAAIVIEYTHIIMTLFGTELNAFK